MDSTIAESECWRQAFLKITQHPRVTPQTRLKIVTDSQSTKDLVHKFADIPIFSYFIIGHGRLNSYSPRAPDELFSSA